MYQYQKSVAFQKKFYMSRQILKVIRNEVECLPEIREKAIIKLSSFPQRSSKVRLKRFCLLTLRKRGVKRKFYLNRLKIREYYNRGFFPNYIL